MEFVKMSVLGNDFVVIDYRNHDLSLDCEQIRRLSDRRFGIGADQILILKKSDNADVFVEAYNSDGSFVGGCGNNTLSVAKLLNEENGKKTISIETKDVIVYCCKIHEDSYQVNMGKPSFSAKDIPLSVSIEDTTNLPIDITFNGVRCSNPSAVNTGDSHCVFILDNKIDLDNIDISKIGHEVERHNLFPEKINVDFAQIIDEKNIKMRTWKHGVGEVLACGSGACSIAATYIRNHLVDNNVSVHMKGGSLEVEWNGSSESPVFLTGKATKVFKGELF